MRYRRSRLSGGTYFFTLVLADRTSHLLTAEIDCLRTAIREVKQRYPFEILAIVILPDHLHAIWRLPEGDSDYGKRWSLIKAHFSRSIPRSETVTMSRMKKHERGVWQRRFWEHTIKDDKDLEQHVHYVYYNPVKHGYAEKASDWPYSSIHRDIRSGKINTNWASFTPENILDSGE